MRGGGGLKHLDFGGGEGHFFEGGMVPTHQRGCSIRSPWATKLLQVVHEDITLLDLKKSSPRYTFDLSRHQVSAMSVHYF